MYLSPGANAAPVVEATGPVCVLITIWSVPAAAIEKLVTADVLTPLPQ
jgi:hypothetical protein